MRAVLLACAVGLAITGSALADHLDPQKRITPADQARARAMLLKQSDLGPGFTRQALGGPDPHVDCAPSVSEADLTLTGDVDGAQFVRGTMYVSSAANVYESVADASASWRRGSSTAGTKCLRSLVRREFAKQGIRLVSFRKIAFPRLSQRTEAYRAALSAQTPQGTVPATFDVIVLMHSRAQAQVVVASVGAVPDRAEEVRLGRLVAGRMARAMRVS